MTNKPAQMSKRILAALLDLMMIYLWTDMMGLEK